MDRTLPIAGVTAFRVRTKGVKEFRRANILFNEEWQTVEAAKLSPDQQLSLLNTWTLEVEQIAAELVSATKPRVAGPAVRRADSPMAHPGPTARED